MSLKETRIQFIEFSGRYDLVVDTVNYVDAGADKFIHAGQRWLDRRFVISKEVARWYKDISTGNWYALVPSCRTISEVWMSNERCGKWQLEKLVLSELRLEVPKLPTVDGGQALIWAPASLRSIPEVPGTTIVDKYGSVVFTEPGDHYANNGLIWAPPIGEATTLEVVGNFYQPSLVADNDKNYWTEEEQFALTLAACRALEQSYRNMQGMVDWESAVNSELLGLELDYTDQESAGKASMEGTL